MRVASVILVFLFLSAMSGIPARSGEFWVPHVAENNWHTTVWFYNPTDENVYVQFHKYDNDGNFVSTVGWTTVMPHDWTPFYNTQMDYEGSGVFETSDLALVAKLGYQYQTSPSVCEFQIREDYTGSHWIIPTASSAAMDWFGFAIQNSTESNVDINVYPYSWGSQIAPAFTTNLSPQQKIVDLLSNVFGGIGPSDVDFIEIVASRDIAPPLGIVGNNAQDRHVFYNAYRLYDEFYGITMSDIATTYMVSDNIVCNSSAQRLPEGRILTYTTSLGNFGKLVIVEYGYDLWIKWVTYNGSGDVYSQGSYLKINGTGRCDLDAGMAGGYPNDDDIWWTIQSDTERTLKPQNGAAFAIWYP